MDRRLSPAAKRAITLAVVGAVFIAACGSRTVVEAEDRKTSSSAASAEATVESATETKSPDDSDYGPLAVLQPASGGDDARTEGLLNVTEHCLYLDSVLLAWPANYVRWDSGSRTITFDNGLDEPAVLADGMLVTVGGSTIIGDGDNGEPAVRVDPEIWVQPPHESCDYTEVWGASGATIELEATVDPNESLPDGVKATPFRPDPVVRITGVLIAVHDRPCLAIRQEDGSEIGLVWPAEFVNWDGVGLEVPGEPARYVELGDEIEVAGDWFATYANQYDELLTDPCRADEKLWVAQITDGGVIG